MSATEVLSLLGELESAIRYRLRLHETVPMQLLQTQYTIRPFFIRLFIYEGSVALTILSMSSADDGRVTFTYPGMFIASFTLGGDGIHDQWYLVDFEFDFQGRDGRRYFIYARCCLLNIINSESQACKNDQGPYYSGD